MKADLLHGFRLDNLLVDPLKGQISGSGKAAHVPPKAMEVLLVLATEPGHLVTRQALLKAVWGDGAGSHEALSHAVSELRHALDDHADNPEFIQTLPKRGYRLIASVGSPGPPQEATGRQSRPTGETRGIFENLRQRGVIETAIAYLVFGWLLIQVADIVFSQLQFPSWTATFVTVLVIAGFPIAIALSWFLEFRNGRAVLDDRPAGDTDRRRFGRTYLSIVGALAIAALFVFIYDRNIGLPESPEIARTENPVLPPVLDNAFAVLPFVNVDGSEDTQIFANGLADDLITRLSRVPGLLVSSRGDAFTLEPNSASRKVRERLRVAHYLEGSVQFDNDMLRIVVQMINSATGFHVMSRRFDRPREDFFAVRNAITELTVSNVRAALPAGVQQGPAILEEEPSLDAYLLYRHGVEASYAPISDATLTETLRWYNAALDIDRDFAAAHAGKCAIYVKAFPESFNRDYIDRAQTSCARALALNPNLDVVHSALGELYNATGRYDDAESAYQESLRINPQSLVAHLGLGNTYQMQMKPELAETHFREGIGLHPGDWSAYNELGRFLFQSGRYEDAASAYEKVVAIDSQNVFGYSNLGTANMLAGHFEAAAKALEKAIELEPRANTYSSYGLMNYYLGRFAEAVQNLEHATELAPNDHLYWSNLGDALWHTGNAADAMLAFERAEQLVSETLAVNPNDPNRQMDLAWISAMLGKTDQARALISRAREQAPDDPYAHYIDGLIHLRNENADAALQALQLAAQQGYSLVMMAAEPHLATLRSDPRFLEITQSNR